MLFLGPLGAEAFVEGSSYGEMEGMAAHLPSDVEELSTLRPELVAASVPADLLHEASYVVFVKGPAAGLLGHHAPKKVFSKVAVLFSKLKEFVPQEPRDIPAGTTTAYARLALPRWTLESVAFRRSVDQSVL